MATNTMETLGTTRGGQDTHNVRGWFLTMLIVLLLLALLPAGLFYGWDAFQRQRHRYWNRLPPNVAISGVDVAGKSLEEAAAALDELAQTYARRTLVMRDGAWHRSVAYEELGLGLDVEATVAAAYEVGRTGDLWQQLTDWLTYHELTPVFDVDADRASAFLNALASDLDTPPVPASVRWADGQLSVVPGKPGRALDVEATLAALRALPADGTDAEVPLVFKPVTPPTPDVAAVEAEVEALLARRLTLTAYDVLTDETLRWSPDRATMASWLRMQQNEAGEVTVVVAPEAVQSTLADIAVQLGEGRGFRLEEATEQVLQTFHAGGGEVPLYLTHPERTYTVQPGDILSTIAARFGMPPGLVAEANPEMDPDVLRPGQQILIPSQDVLTPYLPVPGKKIVISLETQRMRVYEQGQLLYEWPVSTGMETSPTHRGVFQILGKEERAYGSQWDLWMPYFLPIYRAGGDVYNGIHELPILANGQRLWAGALGRPASYGCVILGIPEAETLYHWAEVGVVVVVE